MDEAVSERVRAFLVGQIDSVVQLETLLLLNREPQREFNAREVAGELRIDPAWAEPNLSELWARGTITRIDGNDVRYRAGARAPETQETIQELAAAYATMRVSVIALIFSKPASPLRSFVNAFRLRASKET